MLSENSLCHGSFLNSKTLVQFDEAFLDLHLHYLSILDGLNATDMPCASYIYIIYIIL